MTGDTHPPKEKTLQSDWDNTQSALLNVLTDYKDSESASTRSRRAVLNILEDLEAGNTILKEQTREMSEAAESLLHKNAIDKAILESIGDGIIVTDSNRIITFVNQTFEQLTGWSASEVIGTDIVSILAGESSSGVGAEHLKKIISGVLGGKSHTSDLSKPFYNTRKDKTTFPSNSIITPVWLHGEVIGLVKSFRDITREMDIDKTKTEFVSLASHQLRTPLSAINWYTEMLLSGDVGPITEGQEKYLTEVYKGNQRMISLVNALLNVTRMTLGTFVLEPEEIDLTTLIYSVLSEQTPESSKKGLNINTDFAPQMPRVTSDAKLLRMVIQNLISNAIKYTPEGGVVDISLKLDADASNFELIVADSGVGIPKNQQAQIFSRLFRADNVRTNNTEGTGLGLYIVKAIVDNSGGRVWFESEENNGSVFHVELPTSANSISNQ